MKNVVPTLVSPHIEQELFELALLEWDGHVSGLCQETINYARELILLMINNDITEPDFLNPYQIGNPFKMYIEWENPSLILVIGSQYDPVLIENGNEPLYWIKTEKLLPLLNKIFHMTDTKIRVMSN